MTAPARPALDALDDSVVGELEALCAAVRACPHNLMSPRALGELWSRHVPECVALTERLPADVQRLADVGTGGGFPGLVIAVLRPDLPVTLIESTRKKARFLGETARELGRDNVRVLNDRAERLAAGPEAGRYDAVTARAVAPLCQLIPWTLPLLTPDGVLYAVKGASWEEDLDEARDELGPGAFHVRGRPPPDRGDGEPVPAVVMIGRPRHPGAAEGDAT